METAIKLLGLYRSFYRDNGKENGKLLFRVYKPYTLNPKLCGQDWGEAPPMDPTVFSLLPPESHEPCNNLASQGWGI